MKPTDDGGVAPAPARHITPGPLGEAFYAAEYPKLVKILRVMRATTEEAEDAAQKAMEDLFKRSRAAARTPIRDPDAYACRAAIRYFIKERQRDRERLPRELKGGHLTLPYLDDELTACEDEQWVEHVLESLTPAQRDVISLVMDGVPNQEVAEELGKSNADIRQHRKKALDRLKGHPEIVARTPRELQPQHLAPGEVGSATVSASRKEEVQ